MGLSELQSAVARLCTDPAALARWQEDAAAFAREASLTAAECDALAQTGELESFARSLVHKRAREAGHFCPLTRQALGPAYRKTFARYAAALPAARTPAHDALAFLEWLPQKPPPARYERARLRGRRGWAGLYRVEGRWLAALWWRGREWKWTQ